MKEFGVVESWMKLPTLTKCSEGFSTVFGFMKNWHVFTELYATAGGLAGIASLDLDSKQFKSVVTNLTTFSSSVSSFVESIALLDKRNDAEDAFETDHPHDPLMHFLSIKQARSIQNS